jgi:hypothetical protein
VRADCHAAHYDHAGPQRCSDLNKSRSERIAGSLDPCARSKIVGEYDGRSHKHVVGDGDTVEQQHPILYGDAVPDRDAALNIGVIANVAILPDSCAWEDMCERPDARARAHVFALT